MAWYYVEAGQQTGPVDDAQLTQLVSSGRIRSETLVWRDGMANWQPYGQFQSTAPGSAPVAVATATAEQAVCAECGRIFNAQDTIAYGNVRVCSNCKPIFIQKLAEGAKLNAGDMAFAGFWTRFAAVVIDGVILFVINISIGFVGRFAFAPTGGPASSGFLILQAVLTLINLAIGVSYETIMIGKFGATLGKMACKIKVVTADGGQVSYLLALGRYFAKMLSGLILMIGYLMAAWDDEKRALHDRICNTRVIING